MFGKGDCRKASGNRLYLINYCALVMRIAFR